jgi:hypothetical protein
MTVDAWLDALVFSAVDHPGTSARLRLERGEDGSPRVIVTTTAASGKARQRVLAARRFEPSLAEWATTNLVDKAILELLRKGLVGAAPAGLDLLVLTEVGPPLRQAFAVDEARQVAWLGDYGWLRRVDLRTGAVTSIALGDHPAVYGLDVDEDGAPWLLVEQDTVAPDGPFRAPAGPVLRYEVRRLVAGAFEPCATVRIPRAQHPTLVRSLGLARDGTAIVPHADGLAHVRRDGTTLATFAAGPMTHWGPCAAISPGGGWIVHTARSGELRLHDTRARTSTSLMLEMDDVMSLAVHDDGTVDAGLATPGWDFVRLRPSGARVRVDARATEYGTSPDLRAIYSSKDHALTEWNERGEPVVTRPIAGGSRGSRIVVTERAIYVRTSLGVFQRMGRGAG